MSGLFSKPSMPDAPPAPTPVPNSDNAAADMDAMARQQAIKMQRGRSSTLLTGGAGLSDMGTTGKTLLGQ